METGRARQANAGPHHHIPGYLGFVNPLPLPFRAFY